MACHLCKALYILRSLLQFGLASSVMHLCNLTCVIVIQIIASSLSYTIEVKCGWLSMWTTLSFPTMIRKALMSCRTSYNTIYIPRTWGKLSYFLCVEVARFADGISSSQRKYVLDYFGGDWVTGKRLMDKSMDSNCQTLYWSEEVASYSWPVRGLVYKLNYLTITCLNISFSVITVSQFMFEPWLPHWEAVLRIVKYLKIHPGRGFLYRASRNLRVEALLIQIGRRTIW